MKSLRAYIVDTWYGSISICSLWCVCCLLLYAWLGVYSRMEVLLIGLYAVQIALFLSTMCVAFVNFVRRKRKLALGQMACLIVVCVSFCLASGFICYAITFSTRYAREFRKEQKWKIGVTESELPFSVEFRARDPIYSWYDGRVVFKSGKRSEELLGTHYARAYDVFKLTSSEYLLTPRASESDTSVYRINVEKQCAEVVCSSNSHVVIEEQLIQQIRRKRASRSNPQSVNVAEDLTSASPCKDCHYCGTLSAPVIMNTNSANNETDSYDEDSKNQGGVSR